MKKYIDVGGRPVRAHCTRCGKTLSLADRLRNQFRGANIHITEIVISMIENEKPYEFGSVETLCNECKDEFMPIFNEFMKHTKKTGAV